MDVEDVNNTMVTAFKKGMRTQQSQPLIAVRELNSVVLDDGNR